MTKTADKISKATDRMRKWFGDRFKRHNIQIEQISKKPINKNADGWTKTANAAEKVVGVGGHVVADAVDLSAAMLLILSKYFVKASDVIFFDNAVIDFMDRKFATQKVGKNKYGKDKKIAKFTKDNSKVSAYLSWYLMLLTAVGGIGLASYKGKTSNKEDKIENIQNPENKKESAVGTYGEYFDRLHKITPLLIADLISKEGVHVDKNGLHTPYKDSKGVWTIGFGSTMLKDGTKVTKNTAPITDQEAYELARWHLEEGETYFGMYCYDAAYDAVDIDNVNEAFAMGSIIYNSFSKLIENPNNKNCKERFTRLRKLYKENGRELTDGMVKELFKKYPVTDPRSFGEAWLGGKSKKTVANKLGNFLAGGRGMYWRRWLEAGLLTGDITPQMLLDCPANGIPEFFSCMGKKKDAFFIKDKNGEPVVNKKTYEKFKLWLKKPVDAKGHELCGWKRVRDYIPDFALAECNDKSCDISKGSKSKTLEFNDAVKILKSQEKSVDSINSVRKNTGRE